MTKHIPTGQLEMYVERVNDGTSIRNLGEKFETPSPTTVWRRLNRVKARIEEPEIRDRILGICPDFRF